MKKLLILLIVFASCNQNNNQGHIVDPSAGDVLMMSPMELMASNDSLYIDTINALRVSKDSCRKVIYNLNDSITLKNIQINDVKKYLKICIKNPSQDKFLKGWIARAVQ